jgi:hypothetical protein
VILENLSFSSLVDSFQNNGVTGRAISRIESYQDVMDIDETKIKRVVARTFYEDHVVPWKKAGRIPRDLLQPTLASTASSLKVGTSSLLPSWQFSIYNSMWHCIPCFPDHVGYHALLFGDEIVFCGEFFITVSSLC